MKQVNAVNKIALTSIIATKEIGARGKYVLASFSSSIGQFGHSTEKLKSFFPIEFLMAMVPLKGFCKFSMTREAMTSISLTKTRGKALKSPSILLGTNTFSLSVPLKYTCQLI